MVHEDLIDKAIVKMMVDKRSNKHEEEKENEAMELELMINKKIGNLSEFN